jgi:hypothetical protein
MLATVSRTSTTKTVVLSLGFLPQGRRAEDRDGVKKALLLKQQKRSFASGSVMPQASFQTFSPSSRYSVNDEGKRQKKLRRGRSDLSSKRVEITLEKGKISHLMGSAC